MNRENQRIEVGVERKDAFKINVDGEDILAYEGETVAAALLAAGKRIFRLTEKGRNPRGLFCGIGQCQECRVSVDDVPNMLACQTVVTPGCRIRTNSTPPESEEG